MSHAARRPAFTPRLRRCGAGVLACAFVVATMAAAAPPTGNDAFGARIVVLVNQFRVGANLPALLEDGRLDALAREHSMAMASAGRLTHDGFRTRFERSGYTLCVENIGWNYATPEQQLAAWRNSPGHDGNLRDPRVLRMGAGSSAGYVTFIACR
jgi:uncharacterized protein YkwD